MAKNRKPGPGRPRREAVDENFAPTQEAAAGFLGISIDKLVKARRAFIDEAPPLVKGKGYAKAALREWADRHGITARSGDEKELRIQMQKIRIAREAFDLQRLRQDMLPRSDYELALSKTFSAFTGALIAFPLRVNELLEGLAFDDRMRVLNQELDIVRRTLVDRLPEVLAATDDEKEFA